MKALATLVLASLVMVSPLVYGQQTEAARAAAEAADRWLVLVDAGDGGASWDQASPMFQAAVSKNQWMSQLKQARQPLGAFKSRKLASTEMKSELPGAPDGEYAIVQYDTRFEQAEHKIETVIPMRDKDGKWKVSGYFVR